MLLSDDITAESRVLLMPYEEPAGLSVGDEVVATGRSAEGLASERLLGRGLGRGVRQVHAF